MSALNDVLTLVIIGPAFFSHASIADVICAEKGGLYLADPNQRPTETSLLNTLTAPGISKACEA